MTPAVPAPINAAFVFLSVGSLSGLSLLGSASTEDPGTFRGRALLSAPGDELGPKVRHFLNLGDGLHAWVGMSCWMLSPQNTTLDPTMCFGVRGCSYFRIKLFSRRLLQSRKVTLERELFQRFLQNSGTVCCRISDISGHFHFRLQALLWACSRVNKPHISHISVCKQTLSQVAA